MFTVLQRDLGKKDAGPGRLAPRHVTMRMPGWMMERES